ncbi:MAG: hypothetical protein MUC68_01975 [Burkholderiaceae bacterium]|nr:hypothetical protein [Burkholderiaceae bacterium]
MGTAGAAGGVGGDAAADASGDAGAEGSGRSGRSATRHDPHAIGRHVDRDLDIAVRAALDHHRGGALEQRRRHDVAEDQQQDRQYEKLAPADAGQPIAGARAESLDHRRRSARPGPHVVGEASPAAATVVARRSAGHRGSIRRRRVACGLGG